MNQEELIAKIDAFLWELLPEDERAIVQKEIDNNPDFRVMVADRHFQHAVIKRIKKEALTAKLAGLRERMINEEAAVSEKKMPTIAVEPPPMTVVYRRPWYTRGAVRWAIAVSVALLVMTVVRYFWSKTPNNDVQFAYDLKTKADTMFFPKITNDKYSAGVDPKDSADIYFKAGEFGKTIAIYEDYFAQLDEIRPNTEGSFLGDSTQQKAEWQLVLTYQVAKKPMDERIKKLLNQIAQNREHWFHEDARKLQREINKSQ
jgi:hypothetical protein